ncbi:hypothetical protein [Diaminobutyricimonas sp. TR449]|uniref:hypothetical protein n=1 Tax=Diaminobutyricimonas sp. TR449 TaxID=2708076 RepID=UPI00141E8AA3|nr:hypothetical protein [Diaminobutyricimonas sp. TR449]
MMNPLRALFGLIAAAVLALVGYSAVKWARYGQPENHPADETLDRIIPKPEVDEYNETVVNAPGPVTFAEARDIDLWQSPPIKALFWLRSVPSMARGEDFKMPEARGLVAETEGLGWGLLDWDPGRRMVLGAYAQPWKRDVKFASLPMEEFIAFNQPGYAKIVVTIEARPISDQSSLLITRTRVATTDAEARRRFRLYWGPISAGIIAIRKLGLPMIKERAEARMKDAAAHGTSTERDVASSE